MEDITSQVIINKGFGIDMNCSSYEFIFHLKNWIYIYIVYKR